MTNYYFYKATIEPTDGHAYYDHSNGIAGYHTPQAREWHTAHKCVRRIKIVRIGDVKEEFYSYLHSIEQDGKLSHLTPNSPEIQKLRVILGMRPTTDTGNLLNSDKVRELIKEKGLSQQKVAKMIGKGSSWLSTSLVNGRMGIESVEKLARCLNVEVEEIQG